MRERMQRTRHGFAVDGTEGMRLNDCPLQVLRRFLRTAARSSHLGAVDPLDDGVKEVKDPARQSRLGKYKDQRDRLDSDSTSRIRSMAMKHTSRADTYASVCQPIPCSRDNIGSYLHSRGTRGIR